MNQEDVKKLNIPTTPGCYQYFDADGKLLYIGKAANLNKRVTSYWRKSANHTPAKKSMLEKISKVEWIEVGSEIEALLLESNLVKKYQPPYNVVLRDDKRHIYIKITTDEWPRVITTRNVDKDGRYFGPFTSATAVHETIKIIRRVWKWGGFITLPENKNNRLKSNRYPELYGCPEDPVEYKKIIKEIELFLEGRRSDVEKDLQTQIANYELLIAKTDDKNERQKLQEKISTDKYRILNLRKVLAHSNVLSVHDKYAADVVELAKILGLPKTPHRIEGYDISNLFGQEAVGSMVVFAEGEPDKSQYRKFKIKGLSSNLQLPISNSTDTKIKTSAHFSPPFGGEVRGGVRGDDTGMLKEILERRFNNEWPLPDLIIIDGGKGQLNACLSILKKLKLDIPALAVSKGEGLRSAHAPDKIFFPGMREPLKLPLASPALHVVKRVRDEAHRFAIGFHRDNKLKRMLKK